MRSPEVSAERLDVTIERVVFHDSDSGFVVASARVDDDRTTLVGSLGSVRENERLIVTGNYATDPKWGRQFKVISFQMPDLSAGGIRDFLFSGYLKGVGPVLAEAIYRQFGEETVSILDEDPERLMEVRGVGQKVLRGIRDSWEEHSGKRHALGIFSAWGIGTQTIRRILDRWPNIRDAIEKVRSNPYVLAWEVHGVGFLKADEIAASLGVPGDSPARIDAAVGYVLDMAAKNEGHCFLSRGEVCGRVVALLDKSAPDTLGSPVLPLVQDAIERLRIERIITEDDRVYLTNLNDCENGIARHIIRLLRAGVAAVRSDLICQALVRFEQEMRIALHERQRMAIEVTLANKVTVITGGPGTGKTTIIRALLASAGELGITKIALAAPTGKAAKRMQESTGHEASTVHRLLGFGGDNSYDESNPLDVELLVIDEASMLDVFLARAVCRAMPSDARLVFVGDVHQLPSVGAGNVLLDIIESGSVPVVRLTTVYRQSPRSFIALNAGAILRGDTSQVNLTNETDDFFWMPVPMAAEDGRDLTSAERCGLIRGKVLRAVGRLLQRGFVPDEILVLTPMRKGAVGVEEMNQVLRDLINPHGRVAGKHFRIGDRVMQVKNNYDKDVFNGDQGRVLGEGREGLEVLFDGQAEPLVYKGGEMAELVLAYAITVHKSQGCEAPAVVQIISTSQHIMLQRSLLYTGVTRAKRICCLIGEPAALHRAIATNHVAERNSALRQKLAWCP
ncbi:helicase, RecD/TraA family [Desulfovibrio sp. A2]|nr:helicase, RecD/TraA family [Desulfovibrio sp. A2]